MKFLKQASTENLIALALISALSITACGGGGGSDTTVIVEEEGPVRVTPGQKVGIWHDETISEGGIMFRFANQSGSEVSVIGEENKYSKGIIGAPVPVLFDFNQGDYGQDQEVSVSYYYYDDNGIITSALKSLPEQVIVEALPDTGAETGEVTIAYLTAMIQLIDSQIYEWDLITASLGWDQSIPFSPGSEAGWNPDTRRIVSELEIMKSNIEVNMANVQRIMDGSIVEYSLGTYNGVAATFNMESLLLVDKILYNYILLSTDNFHLSALEQNIFDPVVSANSKAMPLPLESISDMISDFGSVLSTGYASDLKETAIQIRSYAGLFVGVTAAVVGAPAVTAAAMGAVVYSTLTYVPAAVLVTLAAGETVLNSMNSSVTLEDTIETIVDGSLKEITDEITRNTSGSTGTMWDTLSGPLEASKTIINTLDNTDLVRTLVDDASRFCDGCGLNGYGDITDSAPPGSSTPLYNPPLYIPPVYEPATRNYIPPPTVQPYTGEVDSGGSICPQWPNYDPANAVVVCEG